MTAEARVHVEAIERALLSGVVDPDGEGTPRRRLDVGIVPVFSDERPLSGLLAFLDWRDGGRLSALVRSGFFSGQAGHAMLVPGRRTLPVARLVLYGLGEAAAFDRQAAAHAAAAMVDVAHRLRPREVLLAMPGKAAERTIVEAVFSAVVQALPRGGGPDGTMVPVWVVADPRHVARLRRLLEGPPRAADG